MVQCAWHLFIYACRSIVSPRTHTHTHTGWRGVCDYVLNAHGRVCNTCRVSGCGERVFVCVSVSVCVCVCVCVFVCGVACVHNTISIQHWVSTVVTLAWCGQAHLMGITLTYFTAYSNILISWFPFKLRITGFMCFPLLCVCPLRSFFTRVCEAWDLYSVPHTRRR